MEGVDYRLLGTQHESAELQVEHLWDKLTDGGIGLPKQLKVASGRPVTIMNFCKGVAQMSFTELCDRPLGSTDYRAMFAADDVHTLLLTDVPQLSLDR